MSEQVEIGVFGGSGFYDFLEGAREVEVDTPYGPPAAPPIVGRIGDRSVAFIPRHGIHHEFPPHAVPYRANLWAMKELGVERIIAPCAVGSLQVHIEPGSFVISDQIVDLTSGRKDTFYDGPAIHVSFAEPYCAVMRDIIITTAEDQGVDVHKEGTLCVIQGPRFSSKAESAWFRSAGWSVVSMTQYPEAILARELEICYANIALVTDYDSGVGEIEPVTADEVLRVFSANLDRLRATLFEVIPSLPRERDCPCATALENARL